MARQGNSGHNLVLSSRTDAGVNVRRNGGVVTIAKSLWDSITERKMIRAVDDRLPEEIAFLVSRRCIKIGTQGVHHIVFTDID